MSCECFCQRVCHFAIRTVHGKRTINDRTICPQCSQCSRRWRKWSIIRTISPTWLCAHGGRIRNAASLDKKVIVIFPTFTSWHLSFVHIRRLAQSDAASCGSVHITSWIESNKSRFDVYLWFVCSMVRIGPPFSVASRSFPQMRRQKRTFGSTRWAISHLRWIFVRIWLLCVHTLSMCVRPIVHPSERTNVLAVDIWIFNRPTRPADKKRRLPHWHKRIRTSGARTFTFTWLLYNVRIMCIYVRWWALWWLGAK